MSTAGKEGKRILLADADAFYVSVARLNDPDGAGREPLLIVGGTPDGRGVVTSASYEAREYGVRSAMPTGQALRLCPKAVVVPVPRDLCVAKSREILSVLDGFTPVVEPASIDEFYLDLTGTEQLYRGETLTDVATRIRKAVLDETGLSVSIGGGASKVIAKLAAKIAKPRPRRDGTGVHIVPPGGELDFMRQLKLSDIPMIGPRFQERLARYNLRTVEDVLGHGPDVLVGWLGEREGRWLYRRVRGIDGGRVTDGYKRKSLGHEETFFRDLESDDDLHRELLRLSVQVASDLRAKKLHARTVTVKLRDSDFTTRQASKTLRTPVDTDRPIYETAQALLAKLRKARWTAARLIGVSLTHLSREDRQSAQLRLFENSADAIEGPRDHALAEVVDTIGKKYGRRSIIRGTHLPRRKD
jgi:DNA polymerase-4